MLTPRVRAQLGLGAAITVLVSAMTILIQGRPPSRPVAQANHSPIVLSAPVTIHP